MTRPESCAHFAPARGNELIYDDLCAVQKVTELRLPDRQCIAPFQAIAIFKPQNGVFRQGAVDDVKTAPHQRRTAAAGSGDRLWTCRARRNGA